MTSKQGTFPYEKSREKDKKNLHPYFTQSGADREENGDQYITNMKGGATAGFKYFDLNSLSAVSACARGVGKGQMEVRTELGKAPIAVISVDQQRSWKEFTGKVNVHVDGTQALYFTYNGEGYIDFTSFTLS